MKTVFVLQHEYEWFGRDEVKFIGVYATHADAEAAVERLRNQPGFRNWPEGSAIDAYDLGADHWVEGFITSVNILVPSKGNPNSFQVARSVWHPGALYEISILDEPERAEFSVGDIVQCEERSVAGHGDSALVAIKVVRAGPTSSGAEEVFKSEK
jgi:hypothetical protein